MTFSVIILSIKQYQCRNIDYWAFDIDNQSKYLDILFYCFDFS